MFRVQPQAKRYFGDIVLGPQPLNWMSRHRSFASREWFESQIRYGEWIRERGRQNYYLIYATETERIEPITVLIKIEFRQNYVLVYHAHVLRK